MPAFDDVRHVSVTINRAPQDVYVFAAAPSNLPQWAQGLSTGIGEEHGEWVSNSPMDP